LEEGGMNKRCLIDVMLLKILIPNNITAAIYKSIPNKSPVYVNPAATIELPKNPVIACHPLNLPSKPLLNAPKKESAKARITTAIYLLYTKGISIGKKYAANIPSIKHTNMNHITYSPLLSKVA
jgi:hypothetical protein